MKKCGFSEFSFGFAVLYSLLDLAKPLLFAPVLPSTYAEGKHKLGYDALLPTKGRPLFLQFKRPVELERRSSKCNPPFKAPFFRFRIPPSSETGQFKQLLRLENSSASSSRRPKVYYVAPRFRTAGRLSSYFRNKLLLENCVFLRPSSINDKIKGTHNVEHFVGYKDPKDSWFVQSEIHVMNEPFGFRDFISDLAESVENPVDTADALSAILDEMRRMLIDRSRRRSTALVRTIDTWVQQVGVPGVVGILARIDFGCDLFIVSKRMEEAETQESNDAKSDLDDQTRSMQGNTKSNQEDTGRDFDMEFEDL
jgi:hypothetical protein